MDNWESGGYFGQGKSLGTLYSRSHWCRDQELSFLADVTFVLSLSLSLSLDEGKNITFIYRDGDIQIEDAQGKERGNLNLSLLSSSHSFLSNDRQCLPGGELSRLLSVSSLRISFFNGGAIELFRALIVQFH